MRVSTEALSKAVERSSSMRQVILSLGLSVSDSMYSSVRSRIERHGISTDHFSRGGSKKARVRSAPWHEVLILRGIDSGRQDTRRLRRALLESGRHESCEACGLTGSWNMLPIVLQIDHVNGRVYDDRPSNLRFLCPNCHSQQDTRLRRKPASRRCADCMLPVSRNANRCRSCNNAKTGEARVGGQAKIDWPSDIALLELAESVGYSAAGRLLGVSDNAVRKRLARPAPKR